MEEENKALDGPKTGKRRRTFDEFVMKPVMMFAAIKVECR